QRKWTSPNSAACATSVVKRSRPEDSAASSASGRPGSWNGSRLSVSASIFAASTSTPRTSNPSCAMQTAWVAPRYPVPITVIRGGRSVGVVVVCTGFSFVGAVQVSVVLRMSVVMSMSSGWSWGVRVLDAVGGGELLVGAGDLVAALDDVLELRGEGEAAAVVG